MTTRRELYAQELMALLEGSADLQSLGVRVERSIFEAISNSEGNVLVVHRGRDTPVASIGVTDRQCILMLTAVVRDAAPDRAADLIFEVAHPIVMGFDSERLTGVTEGPTGEPQAGDAEGGIGVITMQYLLQYQTVPNSLA